MAFSTILILGAGANVGAHVARNFKKNGFKVALATRTVTNQVSEVGDLIIKADFSNPLSIKSIFEEVKAKLGVPNIIVYNAFTVSFTKSDPTSLSVEDFASSAAVNIVSAYAAAREAVAGFTQLPADVIKAFIYTGNRLNLEPMPVLLDLGVGKAAGAHLIQGLAMAYNEKGYNFYYADERKADASPVGGGISGQNHGDFYYELASRKEQGPWDATFVGGKGYVDFAGK